MMKALQVGCSLVETVINEKKVLARNPNNGSFPTVLQNSLLTKRGEKWQACVTNITPSYNYKICTDQDAVFYVQYTYKATPHTKTKYGQAVRYSIRADGYESCDEIADAINKAMYFQTAYSASLNGMERFDVSQKEPVRLECRTQNKGLSFHNFHQPSKCRRTAYFREGVAFSYNKAFAQLCGLEEAGEVKLGFQTGFRAALTLVSSSSPRLTKSLKKLTKIEQKSFNTIQWVDIQSPYLNQVAVELSIHNPHNFPEEYLTIQPPEICLLFRRKANTNQPHCVKI